MVANRDQLPQFVETLREDLDACPEIWVNRELPEDLEALQARLVDSPEEPLTWNLFAKALYTARINE